MNALIKISATLLLTLFAGQALAAIDLKTVSEVEITQTDDKGNKTVVRVPTKKVVPGTEVIYTITATNTGDKAAEKISVKDPIPEKMTYFDGSAFGAGTDITFSVDGGKKFDKPGKLMVKDAKGKPRQAAASDYTHIRWVFQFKLNPGDAAPVWFKAKVK